MKVGKQTVLPSITITWPHKVIIGNRCKLEANIYFKFDGNWQSDFAIKIGDDVFIGSGCEFNITRSIVVGDNTLIASGCKFIDHDHGIALGALIRKQRAFGKEIVIGENVWLGCNVIVLKGVVIGDGAIVAAGAVVTKPIGTNEIWGGVPAKKIGERL